MVLKRCREGRSARHQFQEMLRKTGSVQQSRFHGDQWRRRSDQLPLLQLGYLLLFCFCRL